VPFVIFIVPFVYLPPLVGTAPPQLCCRPGKDASKDIANFGWRSPST